MIQNAIKNEIDRFWITNFQLIFVFVACFRAKVTTVAPPPLRVTHYLNGP